MTNADVFWWNVHKMDKEMGAKKGAGWRTVLKPRADCLTQSLDPECIEYPVPTNWERFSSEDMTSFLVKTRAEATEEDLNKLSGAGSSGDSVVVKTEPVSLLDELKKRIEEIKEAKGAEGHLRKLQDLKVDLTVLEQRAEKDKNPSKFKVLFIEDVRKQTAAVTKAIKLLMRIVKGEELVDSQMPKFIDSLDTIDSTQVEVNEWAQRFGLQEQAKRRKRTKGGEGE